MVKWLNTLFIDSFFSFLFRINSIIGWRLKSIWTLDIFVKNTLNIFEQYKWQFLGILIIASLNSMDFGEEEEWWWNLYN